MSGFHPYQAVLRQQLEERQGSVELVLLEAAFDDELKCESSHETEGRPGCSVEVTHLSAVACDGPRLRVCATAAHNNEAYRLTHGPCRYCNGDAFDCWFIRPI